MTNNQGINLVNNQGINLVKRQELCETCYQVKQLYGSTEQVAPWLCTCNQKSAQSSLPVARHRSNPPTIAAAIAEARLADAIKARRA